MAQIWVMLPTYNEAGNIRRVVERILSQPLDIGVVIVDDNSPDGTGEMADAIVKDKGLLQITDEAEITKIVDQVMADNPGPVEDYQNGKKKAMGFLIGQVMKITKGKANPQLVNRILSEKL